MSDIEKVKALVVQHAADGISASELFLRLMPEGAHLAGIEIQMMLFALQEEGRLYGEELEGQWWYTSIDQNGAACAALEYSPQFAEHIIAASCGAFQEIDADSLIKELDEMIAQARRGQTDTQ
ncbi:MAG: hypothetical protein P0Y58_26515 [Candidatus Pseudomonas phytovorans]|uniref:Uncharacterized protein n=1 Tax=Candidatus Pseudomonas phytovorans TaxID=3121377 RepID=A0AAJ5WIR8_9PSED|nr:hypothetical protein [Pseudomonas sp.]WEK30403.1 MAG: hypothetical protein P0Y58_26515 [Pseudomonas sp.]